MGVQARALLWGLGALIAAAVGYFASRTPEPARTALELVASLCEGTLEGDHDEWLAAHLTETIAFDTTDPSLPAGERSLSLADVKRELRTLRAHNPRCSASLTEWRVRSGAARSWVEGVLRYSDSQFGDLHEERRPLKLAFDTSAAEPRLERVVLGAPERREPEARP